MTGESRIPRSDAILPACTTDAPAPLHASQPPPAAQADKAALRKALHAIRRALDPATKAEWDRLIGERIVAWWRTRQVEAIGVYWPLPGEPELAKAYAQLAREGVRLALPVVLARNAPLAFADWTPGEPMHKDEMGIAVPAERRLVLRPPALLVPCLGFNAEGYRLGYGGGFYDRTLEAPPRPLTLGVAYACLAAQFGSAPHDVALDRIITEAD